jgi:hypothetical protein
MPVGYFAQAVALVVAGCLRLLRHRTFVCDSFSWATIDLKAAHSSDRGVARAITTFAYHDPFERRASPTIVAI